MDNRDWTAVPFEEARSTLRLWREENVRRSEETVELWEHVISRHPTTLGDELWIIYEQVCIAALDCARLDVAAECWDALEKQFPDSQRVSKLQGMRLEAMARYTDALQLYDNLIKRDETNAGYKKRRVAVLKAQGKIPEAIKELCDYMKTFLNDSEAWIELANLYLSEGDYSKSAHCMEELILSQPHNHLFHQRLGEIRYTQGGQDNIESAKVYFAQAVKLNPDNMRALYGLYFACAWLAQKVTGPKKKETINLGVKTAQKLVKQYEAVLQTNPSGAAQMKGVEEMLTSLQSLQVKE